MEYVGFLVGIILGIIIFGPGYIKGEIKHDKIMKALKENDWETINKLTK